MPTIPSLLSGSTVGRTTEGELLVRVKLLSCDLVIVSFAKLDNNEVVVDITKCLLTKLDALPNDPVNVAFVTSPEGSREAALTSEFVSRLVVPTDDDIGCID